MGYEKKTWKDRQSEFPNRRALTPVAGRDGVYEVSRAEGSVYQDGNAFNQANMKDLESRVAAALAALESGAAKAGHARLADAATTATTATTAGSAHTATTAGSANTATTAGSANTATTAGTANNVAWGNVSGKPGFVYTATYWPTIGTGWGGVGPWTQNVSAPGIVAADNPIADIVLSGDTNTDTARLESWSMVSRITTYAGGITVTCLDFRPTVAMPIQLKVVR